jgi:hypothetical protein
MDDGYSTKIAFALDPDVSFWEKTVQPPGLDGGDEIDTTTMHNTLYRTMAARALITLTEHSITAAWDPNVYNNIISNLINAEGSISEHFPDGSTLTYYGFLKTFEPSEHSEGEQPEATITVVPTNYDPVARVEAGPVLASVAGT